MHGKGDANAASQKTNDGIVMHIMFCVCLVETAEQLYSRHMFDAFCQ